jgi:hypothetical protein
MQTGYCCCKKQKSYVLFFDEFENFYKFVIRYNAEKINATFPKNENIGICSLKSIK